MGYSKLLGDGNDLKLAATMRSLFQIKTKQAQNIFIKAAQVNINICFLFWF